MSEPLENSEPMENPESVKIVRKSRRIMKQKGEPLEVAELKQISEQIEIPDPIENSEPLEKSELIERCEQIEKLKLADQINKAELKEKTELIDTSEPIKLSETIESSKSLETSELIKKSELTENSEIDRLALRKSPRIMKQKGSDLCDESGSKNINCPTLDKQTEKSELIKSEPIEKAKLTYKSELIENCEPLDKSDLIDKSEKIKIHDLIERSELIEKIELLRKPELIKLDPIENIDLIEKSELINTSEPIEKSDLIEKSELINTSEPIEKSDLIEKSELINTSEPIEKSDLIDKSELINTSEPIEKSELFGNSEVIVESELLKTSEGIQPEIDMAKLLEEVKPVVKAEQILCEITESERKNQGVKITEVVEMVKSALVEEISDLMEIEEIAESEMSLESLSDNEKSRRQTKRDFRSHLCFICHEPGHQKIDCPKQEALKLTAPGEKMEDSSSASNKNVAPQTNTADGLKETQLMSLVTAMPDNDPLAILYVALKNAPAKYPAATKRDYSSELDTAAKRRQLMNKLPETGDLNNETTTPQTKLNSGLKRGLEHTDSTSEPPAKLLAGVETNSPFVIGKKISVQISGQRRIVEAQANQLRKTEVVCVNQGKNAGSERRKKDYVSEKVKQAEFVHYFPLEPKMLFTTYDPFKAAVTHLPRRRKNPPDFYVYNIDFSVSYKSTGNMIHSAKKMLETETNCQIRFIPEDSNDKTHFKLTGTRRVIEKIKKMIQRRIENRHLNKNMRYMDVIVPGRPGHRAIEINISGNLASRMIARNRAVIRDIMDKASVSMVFYPDVVQDESLERILQIIGPPPGCIYAQQMVTYFINQVENEMLEQSSRFASHNENSFQQNLQMIDHLIHANDPRLPPDQPIHPLLKYLEHLMAQQVNQELYSMQSQHSLAQQNYQELPMMQLYNDNQMQLEHQYYKKQSSLNTNVLGVNRQISQHYTLGTPVDHAKQDIPSFVQLINKAALVLQKESDAKRVALEQQDNKADIVPKNNKPALGQQDNKAAIGQKDSRPSFGFPVNTSPFGQPGNKVPIGSSGNIANFGYPNKVNPVFADDRAGLGHNMPKFMHADHFRQADISAFGRPDMIGSEQLRNPADYKYPNNTSLAKLPENNISDSKSPEIIASQLLEYCVSFLSDLKNKPQPYQRNQKPIISMETDPILQQLSSLISLSSPQNPESSMDQFSLAHDKNRQTPLVIDYQHSRAKSDPLHYQPLREQPDPLQYQHSREQPPDPLHYQPLREQPDPYQYQRSREEPDPYQYSREQPDLYQYQHLREQPDPLYEQHSRAQPTPLRHQHSLAQQPFRHYPIFPRQHR